LSSWNVPPLVARIEIQGGCSRCLCDFLIMKWTRVPIAVGLGGVAKFVFFWCVYLIKMYLALVW
jgi:hypothetical protein